MLLISASVSSKWVLFQDGNAASPNKSVDLRQQQADNRLVLSQSDPGSGTGPLPVQLQQMAQQPAIGGGYPMMMYHYHGPGGLRQRVVQTPYVSTAPHSPHNPPLATI